jgi:hypothetical protein
MTRKEKDALLKEQRLLWNRLKVGTKTAAQDRQRLEEIREALAADDVHVISP